jgi:F plasmid transfer operon protein
MPEIIARMGILILVSVLLWFLAWSGRRFVEVQRRKVLATPALETGGDSEGEDSGSFVRILAFSSADCKQCHQLQAPALRRVQEKRGVTVAVVEVDATTNPELVQHYHVLTVPTTVIMDASGRAHAVNYGFANTQRLLAQVDAVLTQAPQRVS